jgi:glyoxylate utilization-related uncharacterized protein
MRVKLTTDEGKADHRNLCLGPRSSDVALVDPLVLQAFSLSSERWSSGLLELTEGGVKPVQSTKGNFLIFVIMYGSLEVTIHKTTMTLGPGSSFFVPPLNYYSLKNVGTSTSRLSFTQVKIEQTTAAHGGSARK